MHPPYLSKENAVIGTVLRLQTMNIKDQRSTYVRDSIELGLRVVGADGEAWKGQRS